MTPMLVNGCLRHIHREPFDKHNTEYIMTISACQWFFLNFISTFPGVSILHIYLYTAFTRPNITNTFSPKSKEHVRSVERALCQIILFDQIKTGRSSLTGSGRDGLVSFSDASPVSSMTASSAAPVSICSARTSTWSYWLSYASPVSARSR